MLIMKSFTRTLGSWKAFTTSPVVPIILIWALLFTRFVLTCMFLKREFHSLYDIKEDTLDNSLSKADSINKVIASRERWMWYRISYKQVYMQNNMFKLRIFFLLEFFVPKIALTLSFKVTAVNCFSFIAEIRLWGSRLTWKLMEMFTQELFKVTLLNIHPTAPVSSNQSDWHRCHG